MFILTNRIKYTFRYCNIFYFNQACIHNTNEHVHMFIHVDTMCKNRNKNIFQP